MTLEADIAAFRLEELRMIRGMGTVAAGTVTALHGRMDERALERLVERIMTGEANLSPRAGF